ncbi:MAG: hypothetical protein L0Z70_11795 [Chloroflexi bacterium]|nr:hypothetical protein [Chloroflexota bacterium]
MKPQTLLRLFQLTLVAAFLALANSPPRAAAQSPQDLIDEALRNIATERLPEMHDIFQWAYPYGKPDTWEILDIQVQGANTCPGKVVYFYKQGVYRSYWGYASIQSCPSEKAAGAMLKALQPELLHHRFPAARAAWEQPSDVQGMPSRWLFMEDDTKNECFAPYMKERDDCGKGCLTIQPEKICVVEVKTEEGEFIECLEWGWDYSKQEACSRQCGRVYRGQIATFCSELEYWSSELYFWRQGNIVFQANEKPPVSIELSDILTQAGDGMSLVDLLVAEARQVGLTAPPAPGGQPPAAGDEDGDGFLDAHDRCRKQPAPASIDGCPKLTLSIGCGPPDPQPGQPLDCAVQAAGVADGDTLAFEWQVDGQNLCQGAACQWPAAASGHVVAVSAKSSPSGRSATASVRIAVGAPRPAVKDDPEAGFVITYLGCTDEMTSDETLECAAGFQRQRPEVKELVVTWLINGGQAAVETRRDDGSFYTLAQPAPGMHVIEVQATDPLTGRSRVLSTTARVLPGRNAQVPPGAAAGAAAGTLTAVGGWLWGQWWLARRAGRAPAGSPISRLPGGPRENHIYSGEKAREILSDLGILDGLNRMDHSDLRDADLRARTEELLDRKYDHRRVRGVTYEFKIGPDGKRVIDESTIKIIVEEPPKGPTDPTPPPALDPDQPSAEGPGEPEPKEPEKKPPEKKKVKPPVDPKEEKFRERIRQHNEEADRREQEMRAAKKGMETTAKKFVETTLRMDAARKERFSSGLVETFDVIFSVLKDAAGLYKGAAAGDPIVKDFVFKKFAKEVGEAALKDALKSLAKTAIRETTSPNDRLTADDLATIGLDAAGVYDLDTGWRYLPGGGAKEVVVKGPLRRVPIVSRFIDNFETGYRASQDNRRLTNVVDTSLKQRGKWMERYLDNRDHYNTGRIEGDYARKKAAEAQHELWEYQLKKRQEAREKRMFLGKKK